MAEEAGSPAPSVADLYLGNILYALERCAMALDDEQKPLDAAFYRGIGRKLSEERAKKRAASPER